MRSSLWVARGPTMRYSPQVDAPRVVHRRFERILLAIGIVLFATYAAQIWSPLRLTGDAIVLLSLATSAARGSGMVFHGQPTHYPPGYPLIITGLERLGIADSATLVLLNLVCLAIGIASAFRLLRRQLSMPVAGAGAACACTLLSFVVIKHVTLPLSDVPYFGLSLLAIASLDAPRSTDGRSHIVVGIGAAAAAAIVAIAIRTIGVALLPAIVWKLWRDTSLGRRVGRIAIQHRRLSVALVGVTVLAAGLIAPRVLYIREAAKIYESAAGSAMSSQLDYRGSELGELLANVPEAKLPASLHPLIFAVGILGLVLLGTGFWLRRRRPAAVDVYLAGYCAILAVWPYRDARFWLPIIPILFAYLVIATGAVIPENSARVVHAACFAWMLATGAAGLAYSTALSLSGPRFADRYGDGSFRGTYRFARGDSVAEQEVNADALAVLLKFGQPGTAIRTKRAAALSASVLR